MKYTKELVSFYYPISFFEVVTTNKIKVNSFYTGERNFKNKFIGFLNLK